MLLSATPYFHNILNVSPNQLNYYITDYNGYGRELDYLLKGYSIPYYKVTSISVEAYNIPPYVSKKLNRYFYFKIIPQKDNNLQYILYSFCFRYYCFIISLLTIKSINQPVSERQYSLDLY